MEKFRECFQQANKFFNTADHLVYITLPLIKDLKLLLTASENLYLSVMNNMDAILEYDKLYKRIDILTNDFDIRFDIFKKECVKRYKLKPNYINMIAELRNISINHKKSPIEFIKNNRLIICTTNYQTSYLTLDKIKMYLPEARQFLNDTSKILK